MPEVKTKKAVLILSIEAVTFGFGMAVFIPRNTECIVKGTIAVPQMVYVTSQFANHVWCGRAGNVKTSGPKHWKVVPLSTSTYPKSSART